MNDMRNGIMQRCIAACQECRDVCLKAVTHCLQRGGRHAEASHITTLLDCIDICTIAESFMLRDSPAHRHVCEVCAEVCDACAKSCAAFHDDDMMKRCAAVCQRCAGACREMVRMTTGA
jgi:hypothetical protein